MRLRKIGSIRRIMPRLITERIKELRQEIAEITDTNRKYLRGLNTAPQQPTMSGGFKDWLKS